MGDHIKIVPYNPEWPEHYIAEYRAIKGLLGEEIKDAEHVGSTAIPGLAAKNTIDIMIGVETLNVNDKVIDAFKSLGYNYHGEYGIPGRHFFRKGLPPTHHVHWVVADQEFWITQLLFRDYMRAHPEAAKAYEDLKRGLAEKYRLDRKTYTKSKHEFIEEINRKARIWRSEQSK